jgi:hypothetical protein
MRSLSVSFQGESFFYQTSRAPRAASPSSPGGRRGPTPERRKSVSSVPEAENTRPQHRWPAAKPKASDPLARSLDCSLDRKDSILAAVHLLRRSMAFDSTTSLSPSYHYPPHRLPPTFSSHLLAPVRWEQEEEEREVKRP